METMKTMEMLSPKAIYPSFLFFSSFFVSFSIQGPPGALTFGSDVDALDLFVRVNEV